VKADVKKRKVRESARESEGELVGEIYTVVKDATGRKRVSVYGERKRPFISKELDSRGLIRSILIKVPTLSSQSS